MQNDEQNAGPFIFDWRLESIEQLKGQYRILTSEHVSQLLGPIKESLKDYPNATPGWRLERQVNIADLKADQVREVLLSFFKGVAGECCIMWLNERVGLAVNFCLFVQYYDDFYYPSSDDLVVTDFKNTFTLFFDHEEIISYYRSES